MQTHIPSSASVLVIAGNALWERDFLHEIIAIEPTKWSWIDVKDYRSRWQQMQRIMQCAAWLLRVRRGVLVFSSNELSYKEARFLARLIKPRVLVHLSDEFGTRADYARLSDEVNVLVRQHHHGAYGEPANVLYMPLGYMVGMLTGRGSTGLDCIPAISDREHIWSFAGNPKKHDRREVLRLFTEWNRGVQIDKITPDAVFDLYKSSIFVPSPRGAFRLDCFRLYEASLAGAIPVVAGSRGEIADTFCMEEDPPWIIADTWKLALEKCQAELECPALLQERQKRLLAWWKARVQNVRLRISRGLRGEQSVHASD